MATTPAAHGTHPTPELPDARARLNCCRRRAAGILAEFTLSVRKERRPGPAALPLVLLLLALATLFLFGGDREYFYRGLWYDRESSKALVFAENLSFRHYLVNFFFQSRDADGNPYYHNEPYNRFPIGAQVLVQPVSFLFGDTDFRAKIYAGRMLMLLLFSAAAVLAYCSLARIVGSRWDALTATLLAFSSYYLLYYADMISNEVTIDLFAVMLAFHGMVVFVQECRFRHLLVKSCAALLLGWHVYAFLLPFIVFGLTIELLKARRFYLIPSALCNLKQCGVTLLRSRYLLLGIVVLLFGSAVLSFNFVREYIALDGEVAWRDLPSLQSAIRTTGNNPQVNAAVRNKVAPRAYLPNQLNRIAGMALPYALNPYASKAAGADINTATSQSIALGVITLSAGLATVVAAYTRRRLEMAALLATLTFSGLLWAGVMRTTVWAHDFESVFYIGLPLTAFAGGLLCLRRFSRIRLAPFFAMAALLVFIFSVSKMAGVGQSPEERALADALMADYAAIRNIVDDDEVIFIPSRIKDYADDGAWWSEAYYLAGKTVTLTYDIADAERPRKAEQLGDYLLLPFRDGNSALLTPDNRRVFLYRWPLYAGQYNLANLGRPIIAEDWQVYLRDGVLSYVSAECVNRNDMFLLHFIPRYNVDLLSGRRDYGYNNNDFAFRHGGIFLSNGTCVINRPLPEYDIIAIRTGQYNAAGRLWEGEYRLPP